MAGKKADVETIENPGEVESEEELFGENLGAMEEPKKEVKKEEILTSPDETKSGEKETKESAAKEEVEEEPEKKIEPKEIVPKESVEKEVKEPLKTEAPKDDLDEQIRAAVKEALPKESKEEPKKEEDFKDRFFQTQQYATQVNQENIGLKQNLTNIEQQLATTVQQLKDAGIEIDASKTQYQQPQPTTQYQQPQIDPRLNASLTSADSRFGQQVVDEYLNPQIGKFHKMLAEGDRVAIYQKIDASLDPLVEAINLTKEWEQGQAANVTRKAEDQDALISGIVAKVREQIGIGGQPSNGGKSRLPTNLSQIRSDSNVAEGVKLAKVEEEEEEVFNEHLG